MIISFIIFLIIFLFHSFFYKHDLFCIFNIIFTLISFFSIYSIFFNRNKIKRECFINCIFEKTSFLYKILNSYIFIGLISLVLALFYTLVLILFLIKTDLISLIIIFIGIFLADILFKKLSSIGIKKEYNDWILIGFISFISSSILSIILIIKNYYFTTLPQFLDIDLIKTYKNISHIYFSNCWFIQKILNYSNLLDSLKAFISEKVILLNLNSIIKVFAVLQFLFVSFIGIYSIHYIYFFIKKFLKDNYGK